MAIERLGSSITGSIYLRQAEGPWIPKLKEVSNQLNNFEIELFFRSKIPYLKEEYYSDLSEYPMDDCCPW